MESFTFCCSSFGPDHSPSPRCPPSICPGRFTGENSVFIAFATMLLVLSFDKEHDEEGNEITVNAETTEYGGGLGR